MKRKIILYSILLLLLAMVTGYKWGVQAFNPTPQGLGLTKEKEIKIIEENHYFTFANPRDYLEADDLFLDWVKKEFYLRFATSVAIGVISVIILGIIIKNKGTNYFALLRRLRLISYDH